jgi:tetratricopeptide (TPR) repeat protein
MSQALARAVELFNAGQPGPALCLCRQALDAEPAHPGLQQLHASLLLATDAAEAALAAIAPVLARHPDHLPARRIAAQARAQLARHALDRGQAQQAVDWLAAVAAEAFAPPEVWYDHARALRSAGRPDQARAAFDALLHRLAALPDQAAAQAVRVPACFGLALACEDEGNLPAAAAALAQVLTWQPDHVQALINLALIEQRLGHLDAALDLHARAWRLQPAEFGRIAMALSSQSTGVMWLQPGALQQVLAQRAPALVSSP